MRETIYTRPEKINKYSFKRNKTYVVNHLDKEWVFIKPESLFENYMIGVAVFSKRDYILDRGQFPMEYKDIVDFREASDMENYFFIHHFNAINIKKFIFNRIDDKLKLEDVNTSGKKALYELRSFIEII